MEKIDKDLQKRVWDRVQAKGETQMPPLRRDNLKPWIMAAQENVVACQNLSRQLSGRQSEQLRRLEQELQRSIAIVKGICTLRGESVKLTPLPAAKEPPRRCLEKCYHRQRHLWEEAERRSADPEYGMVFSKLARQTEEHCALLAELLGKLE